MNIPSTKGLGALALSAFTFFATACGSSVVIDADGDGPPDDEDVGTSTSSGGAGSGPGSGGAGASGPEPACAPGSDLIEIAPWEHASSFIALHDDWVYWTTDTTVERAPRAGGGPVEVLAAPPAPPMGIDVDDGGAYVVVDDGTLVHVGHQGGPSTVLAKSIGLGGAFSVVRVDDDDVYFRLSCEELGRVPKVGGPVEVVATTPGCFGGFVLGDHHLYAVDQVDGSIVYAPKNGGATALLVEGSVARAGGYTGAAAGIVAHDDAVYWVSADGGFVGKIDADGGDMTVVADGLVAVQDVAVVDDLVYWSEQGRVGRTSTEGQGGITLVDEPIGIVPMSLVGDDQRLFFTNYVTNGAVLSVCR